MKTVLHLAILCAFLAFLGTAAAAEKAPALPIEGALKIALDYLKEKPEPRAIVALTYETPALGGASYWHVRWSAPFFGGAKPELGLQIDMKGELTRIVGGGPQPGPGQRRYGARDMR